MREEETQHWKKTGRGSECKERDVSQWKGMIEMEQVKNKRRKRRTRRGTGEGGGKQRR